MDLGFVRQPRCFPELLGASAGLARGWGSRVTSGDNPLLCVLPLEGSLTRFGTSPPACACSFLRVWCEAPAAAAGRAGRAGGLLAPPPALPLPPHLWGEKGAQPGQKGGSGGPAGRALLQGTGTGGEGTARGGSDWILGKNISWKGLSSPATGWPGSVQRVCGCGT